MTFNQVVCFDGSVMQDRKEQLTIEETEVFAAGSVDWENACKQCRFDRHGTEIHFKRIAGIAPEFRQFDIRIGDIYGSNEALIGGSKHYIIRPKKRGRTVGWNKTIKDSSVMNSAETTTSKFFSSFASQKLKIISEMEVLLQRMKAL